MTTNEPNDPNLPKLPTRKLAVLETVARLGLGLLFAASGLNHILRLVPMPPMAGATAAFWHGLEQASYFFPLLGAVELVAGALLLSGRLVPLALMLVAPVALNVAAFHAVLAPEAMGVAAFVCITGSFLAWRRRAAFTSVLAGRSDVGGRGVRAAELVLGLGLVASGIAGLLGKTPPPATASAAVLMQGLAAAGYFLPALALIQIACGALLVSRRHVALALAVLAPLVVEIVAYRLWVAGAAPRMVGVAAALLALEVGLAWAYRAAYAPLAGGADLAASRALRRASRSSAFLASNAMASRVAFEPKMNPSTIPSTKITGM